jgi:hypothetical protein
MSHSPERMWDLLIAGSQELADSLGLEAPPPVFTPQRALGAVDAWLSGFPESLDQDTTAQLAFFLARVLIETHQGGLTRIKQPGHALDGEWAITGFQQGLATDYHVPFMVSAMRIGVERELTATEWYAQTREEGR